MRVRMLQDAHLTDVTGLIVVAGRHAGDAANEVLARLLDLRLGLDTPPVQIDCAVRQVAIDWRERTVEVLVVGEDHAEVFQMGAAWPTEPIRRAIVDPSAARGELAARLRAVRLRRRPAVWLVGVGPDRPAIASSTGRTLDASGTRDTKEAAEHPQAERTDPFALLEELGLVEVAGPLRALAEQRPDLAPLDVLRSAGFDGLADRLSGLCGDAAATAVKPADDAVPATA